jgi:hypothetical protein
MDAHPACEACNIVQSGQLHHCITRNTGGPSEDWNELALCVSCHTEVHAAGRRTFARRYPHLESKIREACKRMGRKF